MESKTSQYFILDHSIIHPRYIAGFTSLYVFFKKEAIYLERLLIPCWAKNATYNL